MAIPVTGLVLIPLGLLLAAMPWRFALVGLTIFATMSPAAVVNVGNFGLQPGYYLALLLIGRTAAQIMTDRFTFDRRVLSRLLPLFWFVASALLILFLALCFFQGDVETLPGTSGYKSSLIRPFHVGRENFTQLFYLIVNGCLIYAMAHNGARQEASKLPKMWHRAIVGGLVFAVAICAWQFAGLYGALPFPADFFYSNAGYSRSHSQTMMGLFRINGPFEEPSVLGYNFTGFLFYAWGRYGQRPNGTNLAMVAACILCLLVSGSTTAFTGLFMFVCLAAFDLATGRAHLLPGRKEITPSYFLIGAVLISCVTVFLLSVAANWGAIEIILQNTLFNKTGSTSFHERSFADLLALRIFSETYGIGIGLGSHKANSLFLTLLSNTGIAGVLLFGWFLWGLLRPGAVQAVAGEDGFSARPFQLGLAGLLAGHLFSNPNLSVLAFWLAIGGLLALQVRDTRLITSARASQYRIAPQNQPRKPLHAST
ncbi:MAG TPA: hypothetical protein VJ750_11540 [Rhizomicrobium sp.]|nr:hypothetical protein [Rhizomicrobium sp.]